MKSDFSRAALFSVIAIILLTALYSLSNYYSPPYPSEQFKIRQLLKQAADIEAIAVGNSHNYALDFEVLGFRGYHIWQGGNDVFEAKYQIEELAPKLPNVKVVFFSMSYFTFHRDNAASNDRKRAGIRRKYYAAIPSFKFIRGDLGNFILGKLSPLVRSDHWQNVFNAILHGRKIDTVSDLNAHFRIDAFGKPLSSARFSCMSMDSLIKHTIEIGVPEHIREQNEMLTNHANLTGDSYEAIVSIIKYLQKRNIRIIFYTPPFFELYTALFDQKTIREMKEKMNRLVTDFSVEYYDFSRDSSFVSNNLFFRDDDHLNEDGAKLFSAKLRRVTEDF